MESPNIYQRLHNVCKRVRYVRKTSGGGLRYSVVTHDRVVAAVRPALVDEGVVCHPVNLKISQDGNRTAVEMTMRYVNVDNPQDYVDVPSAGYGIDQQDKGVGKAISYAKKYAHLLMLSLETGDDPDLDQETDHQSEIELACERLSDSIQAIKAGIAEDDLHKAAEAWFELDDGDKQAIWVAPSKGGPFTTEERRVIKTSAFREAYYGAAA